MKYLAYGSNMVKDQMKIRCKNSKRICTYNLKDYKLVFKRARHGVYLDIVKNIGTYVPCVIWEISKEDEIELDIYEDFPESYTKKEINTAIGKVLVYTMLEKFNEIDIPDDEYYLPIKKTYEELEFDIRILENAKKQKD